MKVKNKDSFEKKKEEWLKNKDDAAQNEECEWLAKNNQKNSKNPKKERKLQCHIKHFN